MFTMPTRIPYRLLLAAPALAAVGLQGAAQERERSEIPAHYTWDLSEIFSSIDQWRDAKARVEQELPALERFEGRLGSSPSVLADALEQIFRTNKELSRLYTYATLLADQDTRDAAHEGMRQEMVQVASAFAARTAYVEPGILGLEPGTIQRFLKAEPRLAPYRFYLEDIVRRAPHTLSPGEEKILADATPLAGAPGSTYTILANAEFPYPTVRLSDGTAVRVNQANYSAYRASRNRQDREVVMSAFFRALGDFSRTLGSTMNASVQKALFFAKARKYPSALESALDGPNIPVSVYTRLVDGVNRNLPSFHRYLRLRQRMLGVDQLHYYDLYAPLVESVDLAYTPEQAQEHIKASLAPLGDDYVSVLTRAFTGRWIDMFPTPGKRSGAYSHGGAYDVHPYMLMNYNGKYDDMSTLTHELGHAMHSYFSNRTQPYPTARYPTFVAEVASTFNESLLVDYMLRTIVDDDMRLSLLGSYLENIKGTVFRQTQFAEFELAVHQMAQRGQSITGAALAALYMDITKKYYGHDQGVTVVDDYVAHEWSYIPHFYREFYVFQYATSFAASEALAQRVKAGDPEAVKRYLAFLSAGGSNYPIELLKQAGVDMTTDEPLDLTIREMNRVMDEMEALLAKRAAR
jgi:oligoendopeptidase F